MYQYIVPVDAKLSYIHIYNIYKVQQGALTAEKPQEVFQE